VGRVHPPDIGAERQQIGYSPDRTVPAVHEIAFGVAATLVAILPLRAVLVPSSLPSLTRLDIAFGISVALLVALSVTWVIVWPQQTPAESPGRTQVTTTVTEGPPGNPNSAQPPIALSRR
jgi:hypothetical protein